mgnify:FL=1
MYVKIIIKNMNSTYFYINNNLTFYSKRITKGGLGCLFLLYSQFININ